MTYANINSSITKRITLLFSSVLIAISALMVLSGCNNTERDVFVQRLNDAATEAQGESNVETPDLIDLGVLNGEWELSDIDSPTDQTLGGKKDEIIEAFDGTRITFDTDAYKVTYESLGETSEGTFIYDKYNVTVATFDDKTDTDSLNVIAWFTLNNGKLTAHNMYNSQANFIFDKINSNSD